MKCLLYFIKDFYFKHERAWESVLIYEACHMHARTKIWNFFADNIIPQINPENGTSILRKSSKQC